MRYLTLSPLLLAAALTTFAADPSNPNANPAQIERGRYLCEQVSMCGDCHTPRTNRGEPDRSQWLQGSVLHFKPENPMPFAAVAPPIAGLPSYATDEMALRFFETGTNSQGKLAMPPMPQFRFQHDDAMAMVAYLRALKK